jgi:hypothetical protein
VYAALSHRVVGQRAHAPRRPAQDRDLEARAMVEMDVQGRDLQVEMIVLGARQPPPEIA